MTMSNNIDAILLEAKLLIEQGTPEPAKKTAKSCYDIAVKNIDGHASHILPALRVYAEAALANCSYVDVDDACRRLFAIDPGSVFAISVLAASENAQRNFDLATKWYKRLAHALPPESPYQKTPREFFANLEQRKKFNSQWGQDIYLHQNYFRELREGIFLEVGASDGISLSNTLYFERSMGWRGILIEPNPTFFRKLVSNRQSSCFSCLLSEKKGVSLFLDYAELGGMLRTMDRRHIEKMEEALDRGQTSIDEMRLYAIQSRPLMSIIKECGISRINYFSLDVEGAELEVLEGIDFSSVEVDIFTIEDNYKSVAKYKEILEPNGYEFVRFIGGDALFTHKRVRKLL